MPLSKFQKELENDLKKSVKLIINDNRSTMLSVKWEPHCAKISLHRFFLSAPAEVMNSIARYIKQKGSKMAPGVKSFIEENVNKIDFSRKISRKKFEVQGQYYNLKSILDELNREYFDNQLDLNITWFGKDRQDNRSRVTFGLYHEPLRLIKINRLLDSRKVPYYLVSFIIYHEILHHVCPPYLDQNGRRKIHNREFKAMEQKFRLFENAQDWITKNRDNLFSTHCFR